MNLLVLTSSRADYGIYRPLLKKLEGDSFFKVKIAAFGTHTSTAHGNTVQEIIADGFTPAYELNTVSAGDRPEDIAQSMSLTTSVFAEVYQQEKQWVDLIICLGDRYEMFAAVAASVPFAIPVAHLHGGEETLGAIDNVFRHSITSMSAVHFASTESHAGRVKAITGTNKNIFNVGALGVDNVLNIPLFSAKEFEEKFGFAPQSPVLVTFHPETVSFEKNEVFAKELVAALSTISQQIVITLPNADTMGNTIRRHLLAFGEGRENVHIVESFGTRGYFTCMAGAAYLLGNTSSGIIEAASFGKYVINLGDRQKGREAGPNVLHCEINAGEILKKIETINSLPQLDKTNIYGDGHTAARIVDHLKNIAI